MFESCHNPLCKKKLDSGERKPGTPKKFCSDRCKVDTWALRRAAFLLWPLGSQKGWQIVRALGDTEPRTGAGSHALEQIKAKFS